MHRAGIYQGTYTYTRDHYLHIPLLVSFSFGGNKVRGYFDAGGYAGPADKVIVISCSTSVLEINAIFAAAFEASAECFRGIKAE